MKMRVISLILVIVLLLGVFPVVAAETEDLNLYWKGCDDFSGKLNIFGGTPMPVTASLSLMPRMMKPVVFYRKTESGYALLSGGTLTAAEGKVNVGEPKVMDSVEYYIMDGNQFCTDVLSYTVDGKTYSGTVAVDIPAHGWFYSTRNRSQSTWLQFPPEYDPVTGSSFWFMNESGFFFSDIQNRSFEINGQPCGTVTPHKRDETVADDKAQYDLEITLDAGLSFSDSNLQFKLEVGEMFHSGSMSVKQEPGLMYRRMQWNGYAWYEDTNRSVRSLNTTISAGNNLLFLPYYGTSANCQKLELENATLTSSNPLVVTVEKTKVESGDGNFYVLLRAVGAGQATVTYTCGNESYDAVVTAGLPDEGLYSSQTRSGNTLLTTPIMLGELDNNRIWVLRENGYTDAEINRMTVKINDKQHRFSTVRREDGNLDICVEVPDFSFDSRSNAYIEVFRYEDGEDRWIAGSIIEFVNGGRIATVGGLTVGFMNNVSDGVYHIWDEGRIGHITTQSVPDQSYTRFWEDFSFRVAAGVAKTDEMGSEYHEIDNAVSNSITVSKIWIEPGAGNAETFSLSSDGCVQSLTTNLTNPVQIYFRHGLRGIARLCMQVQVTVGDETINEMVAVVLMHEVSDEMILNRPADDTVEELNTALAAAAQNVREGQSFVLHLADTYAGVIQIPAAFDDANASLNIHGPEGNGTKLCGSMALNGASVGLVENVHFMDTDAVTSGMYGGACLNMRNCSFTGYEIAVDASKGPVTLTEGNVFLNNEIAYKLDLSKMGNNISENRNAWEYSNFINNGIAVQLCSFSQWISPYYLRIYDSNFLGNGVDFDVQADATLYFYSNFFARWNTGHKDKVTVQDLYNAKTHSAVNSYMVPRKPIITKSSSADVKVNTNPKWSQPVREAWQIGADTINALFGNYEVVSGASEVGNLAMLMEAEPETEYVNSLTVDWTEETNLLNSLIAEKELYLPAAVFAGDTARRISVLGNDEAVLGVWSVNEEGAAPFDPTLQIEWSEDGLCCMVTVPDNTGYSATLSIACPETWKGAAVSYKDSAVNSTMENGMVTFPVTSGGTYTIQVTEMPARLLASNVSMAPDGSLSQGEQEVPADETSLELTVPYGTFRALALVSELGCTYLTQAEKDSVTSSDTNVIEVRYAKDTNLGKAGFEIRAVGVGTAFVQYTTAEGECLQLPVTVKAPGVARIDSVTVGYGSANPENEDLLIIGGGEVGASFGSSFPKTSPGTDYLPMRPVQVMAGVPSDSQGYMKPAEGVSLRVTGLRIEPLTGSTVFSWSSESQVLELKAGNGQDLNNTQLYAQNQAGEARIWATVEVTIDNITTTHTISGRARMTELVTAENTFGSLEALETYLHDPDNFPNPEEIYRCYLKPGKYTGTLTLPDNLQGYNLYIQGADNGSTVIEGGIDLNGSHITWLTNISFAAPSGASETKAVYNGKCARIANCSFYNYDVALDSSQAGQIGILEGNLFVNNTLALRVDNAKSNPISEAVMNKNTFINNSTAIQILSLHFAIGPYAFRITNSNFINNETDFDVQYSGSYYFYKNYFGDYVGDVQPGKTGANKNNGKDNLQLDKVLQARSENSLKKLLTSRKARVQKTDAVSITANPRWNFPVVKWWYKDRLDEDAVFGTTELVEDTVQFALFETEAEPEYENYLTSDWDNTVILNEEAGDLQLDARAFSSTSAMTIDVLDGKKNEAVGSWTIPVQNQLSRSAAQSFHAGITVLGDPGCQIVIVQNTPLVQVLQPELSVCNVPWKDVQVIAPDGTAQSAQAENGTVTFTVRMGGQYRIQPAEPLLLVQSVDGVQQVLTAAKYAGKQLMIASYGEGEQFLGVTLVTAGADSVEVRPMDGAKTVKVFLVEDLNTMIPLTEALPIPVA